MIHIIKFVEYLALTPMEMEFWPQAIQLYNGTTAKEKKGSMNGMDVYNIFCTSLYT